MRIRYMVGSLFLVGAVYFTVFGGEYGMFELRRIRAERAAEERRLEQVRSEITGLEAWADSLQSDSATIERIARERWGLIRPGERLYRFEDDVPRAALPRTGDGQ